MKVAYIMNYKGFRAAFVFVLGFFFFCGAYPAHAETLDLGPCYGNPTQGSLSITASPSTVVAGQPVSLSFSSSRKVHCYAYAWYYSFPGGHTMQYLYSRGPDPAPLVYDNNIYSPGGTACYFSAFGTTSPCPGLDGAVKTTQDYVVTSWGNQPYPPQPTMALNETRTVYPTHSGYYSVMLLEDSFNYCPYGFCINYESIVPVSTYVTVVDANPIPTPIPSTDECSDGIDNDHDGKIDAADPGCRIGNGTSESADANANSCFTNSHSDGTTCICDTGFKLSQSECVALSQCNDAIDNNGDNLIDANDPGCKGGFGKEGIPDASLKLVPDKNPVQKNQIVTFSYLVENIVSGLCKLSGNNGDSFALSGNAGSQKTSPIQNETKFTLVCQALKDKANVSTSVTIKVVPTFNEF